MAFVEEHNICVGYCNEQNKEKILATYNVSTGYITITHSYDHFFDYKENDKNGLKRLHDLAVEDKLCKKGWELPWKFSTVCTSP